MAIWCISESLALTISVTKISLDYQQRSQPDIWSCKFKSSVTIHLKLIPYTVYKHRKICIRITKCQAGFSTVDYPSSYRLFSLIPLSSPEHIQNMHLPIAATL